MVLGVNQILSALADETRRNILMLLRKGKISSGEIAENLEMTPQALSYHLKKLKEADLIYETKYKNFIYYELNLSVLDDAIMWMNQLMGGNHHETK
ncbi:transcriptional regulator [Globicatella sp. HMSC072A10]|nr:transcriptional regulator [Globicatella sp. HMSC072A10]